MPDDYPNSSTIAKRPFPNRPKNGLMAWEATMGYISSNHSPDAMLKIQIYPADQGEVLWAASASWGPIEEYVQDLPLAAHALRELWLQIAANHVIFKAAEAAVKSPINYNDDEWLDERTASTVDRMIKVAQTVYHGDWLIMIIYQPVENPDTRVQARLIANDNSVQIGGRGPSIREACHSLYQSAARQLMSGRMRPSDE